MYACVLMYSYLCVCIYCLSNICINVFVWLHVYVLLIFGYTVDVDNIVDIYIYL